MHPEIEAAEEEVRSAKERREETIGRIQAACSHPAEAIVESDASVGDYLVIPSTRCCTICGYAEEGWGCGHWKLGNWGGANYLKEYPRVSLDVMRSKYIKRLWTQEEMNELRFRNRQKVCSA